MADAELYVVKDAQPTLKARTEVRDDFTDSLRGWTVVAAAFLGGVFGMGALVVYSFGVLGSAMADDLGFSPTQLSSIFMVYSLTVVVASPLWGALTDRFGGRSVTIVSSILLAGLFGALAILPGNLVLVYVAFAAIGLLASGTLPASYASVVVGWFDKRRGLALGVAMMGLGAGAAILPPLSAALLSYFGWRNTYLVYGALILLICLPFTTAFLKPAPTSRLERHALGSPRRFDLVRAAAKLPTTWILTFFALLSGAVFIGSVANFVPMLQAQGMTRAEAAAYQSILGVSLIVGRIVVGGLIDRIFAPRVMLVVLSITSIGFLAMHNATSAAAYAISAAGIGLALGAEMDFLAFLVSRYYDKAAFGTVFASLFAVYALGAAFGPLLINLIAGALGSYQPGFLILAGVTALVALTILLLPRYARQ